MDPKTVTITFEQGGNKASVIITECADKTEVVLSTPPVTNISDYARLAYIFYDFIKKLQP